MKHTLFVFLTFIFSNSISGQNAVYQDSSVGDYKFYKGKLPESIADKATYIYFISKYTSFIEFSAVTWGSLVTKYRVETQSNGQTYVVTKTVENILSSSATTFTAIDSTIFNALKFNEKYSQYLKDQNVCTEVNRKEPIFIGYFSSFIIQHKLQNQFPNFNPGLFVAWLKIKNNEKIKF